MTHAHADQTSRLPSQPARPGRPRFLLPVLLVALLGVIPSLVRAQAVIAAPSTTFTPADSSRTWMDAGGTWNGTTLTDAGDTFTVTWTNSGTSPAYSFTLPSITLPANFNYTTTGGAMSLTYSGTGVAPTNVTATQAGTTLTPTLTPAAYTLDAGASITLTYRVQAAAGVGTGSYTVSYGAAQWALTSGGTVNQSAPGATQPVQVRAGAASMTMTPVQQTKAVGQNAVFTVTVENTGIGGLFDVTINDSVLQNLQFVSITKVAPTRAATPIGQGLNLPYLAPGEKFVAEITATVLACGTITNTVTSTNRATASSSVTASVQIDLKVPLVQYEPPDITLHYNNGVLVTIPITNAGLGNAKSFRLQTTLNNFPLQVANVASGWTYSAGTFTYTAGTIPKDGGSATLTFEVRSSDPCNVNAARMIEYVARYTNDCGDDYYIPVKDQIVNPPTDLPALSLTKAVVGTDLGRIAVAKAGSYTLTLSAANIANITTGTVTVTDTLPTQIEYLSHSASAGAGITSDYAAATRTVTWNVPTSLLSATRTLTINFNVKTDPCLAGQTATNTAQTNLVTTNRSCTLQESAAASFLITNNPETTANQYLSVTGSPTGGIYEAGNADAGTLGTRDPGEGEFIPLLARYEFGSAYPGTWAGSIYTDSFGGITQMSLANRDGSQSGIEYRYQIGGGGWSTWASVPFASVTLQNPGFRMDLGFLTTATGGDAVAGKSVEFRYSVTATDAAVTTAPLPRNVTHVTQLDLANATSGGSGCPQDIKSRFTQGVFYAIGRAVANISIGPSNASVNALEICKDELFTITVSNANAKQARDILVTLLNSSSDYTYDTSYTPVYGGVFTSGNITYDANGGSNPTFAYTGASLTGNGTIQVRLRRKITGDVTPRAISARVDYDSWDTVVDDPASNRAYTAAASWTPYAIRQAKLAVTVTPGQITVTGTSAEYSIYVINTDAGTAWNAQLTNTLPLGITVDEAATNALNTAPMNAVVISAGTGGRQTLTWSLGNLTPGQSVQVKLKVGIVDLGACNVSVSPTIDIIKAVWGCDSTPIDTAASRLSPSYVFPSGQMTISHDAAVSILKLCETGTIALVLKNTGPTFLKDVTVQDVIPDYLSISGQVQYKIGTGALQNITGSTTVTGNKTLTWTKAHIPELAGLDTGSPEIRIYVPVVATEALAGAAPQLTTSASAKLVCGTVVASSNQILIAAVQRPSLAVTKVGRNVTADGASAPWGKTVYGGAGDTVQWQVTIANNGNATASFLQLTDQLTRFVPGSATISGNGITGSQAITAGTAFSIPSAFTLAQGGTATYIITGTLDNTCANVAPSVSVTWACSSDGPRINTPGSPGDSANLVMIPVIEAASVNGLYHQVVERLSGGRSKVTITVENRGGTVYNPVITLTIPSNSVLDTAGADALTLVSTASDITSVTLGGTINTPVFSFVGSSTPHLLRYGEKLTLTYYLRPNVFDTNYAQTFPDLGNVETTPTLDPTISSGQLNAKLDYTNSCGTAYTVQHALTYAPQMPDLDITAVGPNSDANNILTATTTRAYTFTITNSGSSTAEYITLSLPDLGTGWTVNSVTLTTPGTGGSGGAALTGDDGSGLPDSTNIRYFTPNQVGTLAVGASAVVTVNLTYNSTSSSGPLTLKLRARGEARSRDGTTVNGNYSLDQRAQRIIGVELALAFVDTSETVSTGTNVLIGEDLTYRITAKFRGGENTVSNIRLEDQLRRGAAVGTDNDNFGFVRMGSTPFVTPTANNTATGLALESATNGAAGSSAVTSGAITFRVDDITSANMASGRTIEFDLVARVMNITNNSANQPRTNRIGLSFTYLGVTFNPTSGNGLVMSTGGTPLADFYKSSNVIIRRPGLAITKHVRNLTKGETTFVTSGTGEAGDIMEYRLVVTNNAATDQTRPLYNVRVADTAPAKLDLLTINQGADTNATPATIEVSRTPAVSGAGGTITFSQADTNIPTLGENFTRLDAGKSITLLYRGTLLNTVAPSETLTTSGSATGFSIPVDASDVAVNQLAMKGTAAINNPSGAYPAANRLDVTASGTVTISPITIVGGQKTITLTSAGGDTATTVYVGEQIRYQIRLLVPKGTVPQLRVYDQLPAGLGLVAFESATFGSAFADTTQPTLTPVLTPGTPQSGSPLNITWNFGERLVNDGDEAARTVTLTYIAQVRNVAANAAGTTLTNNAQFSTATGGSPTRTNITPVTVTVAVPSVTVTKQVRNVTRGIATFSGSIATGDAGAPDAGDILEYRVTVVNASGATVAPAYDLNLVETLPAGLTYVAASGAVTVATNVTGAAVGAFEPSVASQVLTWGREQVAPVVIDIAPNGTLTYTYRVTVDDTARPVQTYQASLVSDWTSLSGTNLHIDSYDLKAVGQEYGERIGTGTAPNTLRTTNTTNVTTRNVTSIAKVKSGDTLPRLADDTPGASPAGFRVGDIVTYTVTGTLQEGTLNTFTIKDTLPTGLAFVATDSITPAPHGGTPTVAQPFSYTVPAGANTPAAGATGLVTWNFGNLVNAGDNDATNNVITVVYRARIVDASGIAVTPVSQTLNNAAVHSYTKADSTTHTATAAVAPIIVNQPQLTIAKAITDPALDPNGFYYTRRPGENVTYKVTITNSGSAPAYNIKLTDTLDVGLDSLAPANISISLNSADVTAAVATPTYVDRVWTVVLADNQPLLPAQKLELTYTVKVSEDASIIGGTFLGNAAKIEEFFSKPAADPDHRRKYAAVGPAKVYVLVGRNISGLVYQELGTNGTKDGDEDWTNGVDLTVNLVTTAAITVPGGTPIPINTVVRSVDVLKGASPSDEFTVTGVPAGSYRLIIVPKGNTTTTTATVPNNTWVFDTPNTGSIAQTVTTDDITGLRFGLYQKRNISGQVYNDFNENTVKDGGENWNAGATVYVNIVRSGTVFASTTVNAGAGTYAFTNLVPPGEARVILTTSAASTTAAAPTGWRFNNPSDGTLLIIVRGTDFTNQDFGLFQDRAVRGVVFADIGGGGATANDGAQQSGEPGIGNVMLRLLKQDGTQLDSTRTDGTGAFTLRVPADIPNGTVLIVEETNPSNHISTGGRVGTAQSATYDRTTDRITFTFSTSVNEVTGLLFGDVPVNQLLTDGAQAILPGSVAFYKHTFIAGTSGTVTFTLTGAASPADIPWTQVVLAEPGTGAPIDGKPIAVTAGQEYQLIVRHNSLAGAPTGAINTTTITATFVYGGTPSPALPNNILTRQDVTTLGLTASAGLQLVKDVDKTTALPGTDIEYTITYTNAGAGPLTELFIMDSTPAYTVLVSASADAPLPANLATVTVDAPAVNGTGSIKWTFSGTLAPGASGKVRFKIKVAGN